MIARTDVIIIGAGQAGLAMSRSLSLRGIDHAVLERGRIGERWISERWPGLRLLTPNWMSGLPGLEPFGHPDAFMRARRFADLLEAYTDRIAAPVVTGCDVLSVTEDGGAFRVVTTRGRWRCRSVIVATGACDKPAVPAWAARLPRYVRQIAPSQYKGPDRLPAGGVLIVGASATGVQLASDIQSSGRQVTLAVGRHVRAPRRYRGADLFRWLGASGFLYEPRARHASRPVALPSLQLVGSDDARDIDLAGLARTGVRIAGRALDATEDRVRLAPTLAMEIAAAEVRRRKLLTVIDRHIARSGAAAPDEPQAWEARVPPVGAFAGTELATREIRAVIWATGFRRTYPWLRMPALDGRGEIISDGGETPVAGLFTLGLPFMRHRSSAFIYGAGRDAEAIAGAVTLHLDRTARRAA